jgi:hypothetical protein
MNTPEFKDIRTYVEPYLDYPTMKALLDVFPIGNMSTRKKVLKEKERQCKKHWNYHLDMPHVLKPVTEMHRATQGNLRTLEGMGFTWQTMTNGWFIPERISTLDMMIPGTHPDYGYVQYWRHETKSRQSGSTVLIWYEGKKRKQIQVHKYIRDQQAS